MVYIPPQAVVAGVQFIGGLFGKRKKRKAAKREAQRQYQLQQQKLANEAAAVAYKQHFENAMIDVYNQRTMEIFDLKVDNYDTQIKLNRDAAHGSYAAEKFKLNEQMQQASLTRFKMLRELMKVEGAQAAEGTGNVNRSKARANLINSLGEYGRDQAEFDKTLYSAKTAHNQRMSAISAKHANANFTAWSKIAIAPRMKLPSMAGAPDIMNQVGAQQIDTGLGFGDILSGAASAAGSFYQMGGTNQDIAKVFGLGAKKSETVGPKKGE